MDDLIKLLSQYPLAITLLTILLLVLTLSMIVIYVVAFIQGREISFWPPQIGKKTDQKSSPKRQRKASSANSNLENSRPKIKLNHKDVIMELDAQNDCRSIQMPKENVADFVINESTRHPVLFNSPFTSIPIAYGNKIILLSWDGSKACIERILNRANAYPNSDAWYSCVSLYRQATALQYRTRKTNPLIAASEVDHVTNMYRKLLRNIKNLSLLDKKNTNKVEFDFSVFESLLDEAEFALFNENMNVAVVRLEALLSSIHKYLISNAPQIATDNGAELDNIARPPTLPSEGKKTILIVDDNLSACETLSLLLEDQGYRIAFAKDGEEALKAAVENDFDLVLCDIMMPKITGYEVATGVKIISPKTKILFVTALDDNASQEVAKSTLGYSGFLSKPVDREEFRREVNKLLE